MHEAVEDNNFVLYFESDRLLRKGTNRQQRRQASALEADFKKAAKENAAFFGFECLEDPVSVSLHLHGLESGGNPQLPPVVKAYIDALREIVYDDDCQIEHLTVNQDAWDHPWMSGGTHRSNPKDAKAAVFIEVEPLDSYTDRYDRAYRSSWWRRDSAWRGSWKGRDETKLAIERKRLDPTGDSDLVRFLEEQKLRDGFFADFDRPGPLGSSQATMHRLLRLPRLHRRLRHRSGSMLSFPSRRQEKGASDPWLRDRDQIFDDFAANMPGLPFEGFVGLDIAVRGEAVRGKDLDNLAHLLLVPIEERFCVRRGTVLGYRVYVAHGEPPGIQVRIMDSTRLRQLEIALNEADLHPSRLDRLESWTKDQRSPDRDRS